MSDAQKIAERLLQVVRETDWSDLDRIEDREKLSAAFLDAGLGEAVEALEIFSENGPKIMQAVASSAPRQTQGGEGMSDAQKIAERLREVFKAVLIGSDDLDRETLGEIDEALDQALLDAGLREAVARMKAAHTLLFNLSGVAAIARHEVNLALFALKGEKA